MSFPFDAYPTPARSRWVKVDEFPESKKVGKYSMIVDKCYKPDGKPHSIEVAYVRDHPVLAELDALPGVPRVVKNIYRASVRLKMLRETEWSGPDIDRVRDAWDAYQARMANA